MELNGKRTQEISETTRKLIQNLVVAKSRAVPQTKYKTLPLPEDTPEMINIREEIQQLNQQIEVMGCNRWQFQELHRLRQQLKHLAQEDSDTKWTVLVVTCKADKRVTSLFWQQVRRKRSQRPKQQDKNKPKRQRRNPKTALASNLQNLTRR